MIEQYLIELVQIAIGNRKELTACLKDEEWAALFIVARQQQVLGIVYAAIMSLPADQRPKDQQVFLKWHGLVSRIVRRNDEMAGLPDRVMENLQKEGFDCMLLKGQSLLQYYPEQLRALRSSGDIDVWVRKPGMKLTRDNEVYRYVRGYYPKVKSGYIHIEFPAVTGTELEVHIRPCYLANPWHNGRLQRWFEGLDIVRLNEDQEARLAFNKVFLLLHLYKHFIHEGVTMRQLMDCYLVLKRGDMPVDEGLLRRFGVLRFYRNVLPVMEHIFEGKENSSERSAWLQNEVMRPIDRSGVRWLQKLGRVFMLLWFYADEVLWVPGFAVYSRICWDRGLSPRPPFREGASRLG